VQAAIGELDGSSPRAQTVAAPGRPYRALADARAVRGDPRVRAALDSLDEVEREREAFGVVGGVDPVYVSLTNRVTQLGRVIEGSRSGGARRLQGQLVAAASAPAAAPTEGAKPAGAAGATAADSAAATAAADAGAAAGAPPRTQDPTLAAELPDSNVATRADSTRAATATLLNGGPGARARPEPADSTPALTARSDTARARLQAAEAELAAARVRNQAVDRRVAAARARADVEAPPVAVVLAATALAAAFGFATVLIAEVRRPRLSDAEEAERVTRVRVLAVVRRDEDLPDRDRRQADDAIPALVDASVGSYRLLYLSLSATGAAVSRVAVTAAEPRVAAAVALNVAVAAADDGRSTLVVDGDVHNGVASAALGVRDRLGLADAFGAGLPVADLVVPVAVGRGATVDVLPAGQRARTGRQAVGAAPAAGATGEDRRAELGRVARRYDVTVVHVPPVPAGVAAPSPDDAVTPDAVAREVLAREVIVCARAGHTPLAGLTREIARLNALGARVRGLVVWDDDLPGGQE
jgi:Mrp family chromosome partitioning ATPase